MARSSRKLLSLITIQDDGWREGLECGHLCCCWGRNKIIAFIKWHSLEPAGALIGVLPTEITIMTLMGSQVDCGSEYQPSLPVLPVFMSIIEMQLSLRWQHLEAFGNICSKMSTIYYNKRLSQWLAHCRICFM